VKHVFPDVPINAGTFEPLTILRPEGTFLEPEVPAGAAVTLSGIAWTRARKTASAMRWLTSAAQPRRRLRRQRRP
jgi:N-methylhydantoinase B